MLASVSCTSLSTLDNNVNIFQFTSTGTCSGWRLAIARVIQVGVRNDA